MVRRSGGVQRRRALPRRAAAAAVRSGVLVSPRRGLVALPDLPKQALQALAIGGVLSCGSAADAHGLQLLHRAGRAHVTVPRDLAAPPSPQFVVHRRDVERAGWVTPLARTVADCARCLDELSAMVVIDEALRTGLDRSAVDALLVGPGSAAARVRLRMADERAESSGETVVRCGLRRAGLAVEPQVAIVGVGRVDLLVEGRVVVEIDGLAYHGDARQFAADRRRDAELVGQGYLVLRFTWADAVRRPEYVLDRVRAALAQAA